MPASADSSDAPRLGFGVGLRATHYPAILERIEHDGLRVDWFEALTENYMIDGGRPLRILDQVRASAPVVLHGVSLNLGSSDPLDDGYLAALSQLIDRVEPAWVSDHLCWTGVAGTQLHDLLPLPYARDVVDHVSDRILRVQDRLQRRIAVENVSSYLSFAADEMSEAEFLVAVAERADCGILLDVNNIYVSAHNHGFDAAAYIDSIPVNRVFQIHLAGHSEQGPLLIDTHDHPVCDEVWDLYQRAIRRVGAISTLIEWDDEIPAYERLEEEALRARQLAGQLLGSEPAEALRAVPG